MSTGRRRRHYQLQSTRGFKACVEPTEANAFTGLLTDSRDEVDCLRCISWLRDRDAFVRKARNRQEHAPTSQRSAVGGKV
jgi:hypothetical protein